MFSCSNCFGRVISIKKSFKIILAVLAAVAIIAACFAALVWNGVILLNNPSKEEYPVRGVDVSAYQGEIDWQTLSGEGIDFAFIKATEGSGFTDRHFAGNLKGACESGLRVGAYHFFSYDSGGISQAENFISAVPEYDGMLPPVIDVEFYGDKEKNPPDKAAVRAELDMLLKTLEEHYGLKPVLYATQKSYNLYISDGYEDYDIWIRDVITAPRLSDGREWTFWQYTNRARLDGYSGEEKYIDMNVFKGTAEEFEAYGCPD